MIQKSYIYYPSNDLEKLLFKFIWKIEIHHNTQKIEQILPKGTAELIFNLSEDVHYFTDDISKSKPVYKSFINGVNTKSHYLVKTGLQTFIGIQFHPCAIKYLFKIPANEFIDKIIDSFHVLRSTVEVYQLLRSDDNFQNQVKIIKKWLLKEVKFSSYQIERNKMFNLLNFNDPFLFSIKSICDRYNISDRQLRRISEEYIGLKPIDCITYRRYLHSLHEIHYKNDTLTQTAYVCGFYDQSHFIRVFKEFTGLSPKFYKKNKSKLIGHIFY
ncbi:MAG: helix-turn-helix domain-containing protein [Candidatus Kapabacteria bacterium]|nr:helix-turn-helix domain-containing protein [Candidatus Kapabacteria bacterium]